ncbi:MAG: hypothetical protein M9962_01205 [Oligoflexia bacterium]|nr:hypothetical protein [Oligoflexia bacterium]
MLKITLLAVLSVFSFAAVASATPDSRNLTCKQARDYIVQNSPAVMIYGESERAGKLYAKFYMNSCGAKHGSRAAWVSTIDSPSCFIGWTCNR